QICRILPIGSGAEFKQVQFDRSMLKLLLNSFKLCYESFSAICKITGVEYDERYYIDMQDTRWNLQLVCSFDVRYGVVKNELHAYVDSTFDYLASLELDTESLFSKEH